MLPTPNRFDLALAGHGHGPILRRTLRTLQVNMGKLCNQACHHCHVDAGPLRTERMSGPTVERVLSVLRRSETVETVDITGGAPELNPHFRRLVNGSLAAGKHVIVRCNLTVLEQPGQQDTAQFFAERGLHVIASLPCYTQENVDRQRGDGVFAASLRALRRLNALGYGRSEGVPDPPRDDDDEDDDDDEGGPRRLDLVYNPLGPALPGPQPELERDYRQRLREDHGIVFDRLLTLTNMPIHRFADDLRRTGRLAAYEELLESSFNVAAVDSVMCRDLVSVNWDGRLADCDFHQMADLPLGAGAPSIFELDDLSELEGARVTTAQHCMGCTAGQGSSCGGALTAGMSARRA
jgi:hypothetical protein